MSIKKKIVEKYLLHSWFWNTVVFFLSRNINDATINILELSKRHRLLLRLAHIREKKLLDNWLDSVLPSKGIAIKAGFHFSHGHSFVQNLGARLAKRGTLIGIEPTDRNIEAAKSVFSRQFKCNAIFIKKALLDKEKTVELMLGKKDSWNIVLAPDKSNKKELLLSSSFTDQSIQVEGGTLDEMLIDNEILPETVDYIDLTINGAEYDALKGMTGLLKDSRNLAISVIAFRMKEGQIGFIDGQPDYQVIIKFLRSYGFDTYFEPYRLQWGLFGYIYAWKGDKQGFK